MLTNRFEEAFRFAQELHRNQQRKGTSIPYISHLMAVAGLVLEHGGTEDQAIARLLHDAPEDQGGEATLAAIRVKFGNTVADIVSDCTGAWTEPKLPWRERKETYIARLPHKAPDSLLVALTDKTHSAEAILSDYRVLGDGIRPRFNGGADGTRWYYGALADVFQVSLPGALSERLSRAVVGFAR